MSLIANGAHEARWTRIKEGYCPPVGVFVEFFVEGETTLRYGLTASLTDMGPHGRCETVLVSFGQVGVINSPRQVFFVSQVLEWRETLDVRQVVRDYLWRGV